MGEDGFYVATRVVNPILMKYRAFIVQSYGLKAIDRPQDFIRFSDVAVYAELERMRDDLARGGITKDSFADGLLKLASKYSDLAPEALQVLRELYERLTGLSFPTWQTAAPQLAEQPSSVPPARGVCARCVVEGDRSEKQLIRCSYCGDVFCERHATPRLTMSFNQYQLYLSRYPDIAHLLREHWESETGHPCTAYTSEFWSNYKARERRTEVEYAVPVKVVSHSRVETETSVEGSAVPVKVLRSPQRRIAFSSGAGGRVAAVAATFVILALALSYAAGFEGFLASLVALAVGVVREITVVMGHVR